MMTNAASAPDLALIAEIDYPLPAGADASDSHAKLDRAARAAWETMDAAMERRRAAPVVAASDASSDPSAADLVGVFVALERRCRGNRDLLGALLQRGAPAAASVQRVWFEVGRAAAEAGRADLTEQLGHFLVASADTDGDDAEQPGLPSRRAHGLHLLMLASAGYEAKSYAKQAKKAYLATRLGAPADVWARIKAPSAVATPAEPPAAAASASVAPVPTIVAPTKVVPMANASTPGQSPIKPVPPATSAASETAAADPAEPGDPSGMTISMRELVDLLVGVGETKLGGTAITRHAVRARMRKPDDAPAEYADLVKLKDAKTGRFPKAEALAVVARVAARVQQK